MRTDYASAIQFIFRFVHRVVDNISYFVWPPFANNNNNNNTYYCNEDLRIIVACRPLVVILSCCVLLYLLLAGHLRCPLLAKPFFLRCMFSANVINPAQHSDSHRCANA